MTEVQSRMLSGLFASGESAEAEAKGIMDNSVPVYDS